jgi:hypothetical protein
LLAYVLSDHCSLIQLKLVNGTTGQPDDPQSSTAGETGMFSSCSQKLNFLHSSEYVLTYEDRESDLMLVGDVPWEMFTTIVRRLRIMKGVDIARRGGGDNPTNSQVEAV